MPGSGTWVPLEVEVLPVLLEVDVLVEVEVLLDVEVEDEPEVEEVLDVLVQFFLQPPHHVALAGAARVSAERAIDEISTLRTMCVPLGLQNG